MDPQLIIYVSLAVIALIMIVFSMVGGRTKPVGHL
jgi:preprotein translocase subunit Sec61beta